MKIGDIVNFDCCEPGIKGFHKIVVGRVVDVLIVGSDDAEWFEIEYYINGNPLIVGRFESDVVSCLGPDTLDLLVAL